MKWCNWTVVVFILCGTTLYGILGETALSFDNTALSETEKLPDRLNPQLKYPTIESYESAIKEQGIVLDAQYVRLFAPTKRAKEAKIILGYLVKAYDELYRLVGLHTKYKMVVYHFPEGHPDARGGTSNCTIWYGYKKLELEFYEEWKRWRMPHVSGYIEEMAHNFVAASSAQFGWEMIGWSIGSKVTEAVAGNRVHREHVRRTRSKQARTFNRYKALGCVFPADIPPNLCDRIHAHILWMCERKYGSDFWVDFFGEVRKQRHRLNPLMCKGGDEARNQRYQITVDCFDQLPGLAFKKLLEELEISTTVDVKSLHPTEPGWDRRFVPSHPHTKTGERAAVEPCPVVDAAALPELHKAAYGGHAAKVKQLIEQGADVGNSQAHGWMPLHMAAIGGHRMVSATLIRHGASIYARDDEGRTTAKLAEVCGHEELAAFLQEQK